jgi:hypothetical protein
MSVNYAEIFLPITAFFNQQQLTTIFLAYLPSKLESYLTGIIAVDMPITNLIACGVAALIIALFQSISTTGLPWGKKNVTIQIEYYTEGRYGYLYTNVFYEALSWLISQQTKKLNDGSFVIQTVNSIYDFDDDDDCAPPNFNVLPENNQEITIEYKGKKYKVTYQIPQQENNENNERNSHKQQLKPSIYLTTTEVSNDGVVNSTSEFLNEIVRTYLEDQKKKKVRSRYERNDSYWQHVQSLSSARGLDSIALDESHEQLLKKELETFVNDKSFYERIGMPYRRGILLYGKPGTGKTSLINAISSQLNRDIYYLNLKNIKDDNELSAAFSDVPENQIIVLEDVDTQSKVLHKRTRDSVSLISSSVVKSSDKNDDKLKDDKADRVDKFSEFSLSTFLGCLDGHILAEGNIIIMTTNHVEHLDPACIRPGRMDVQLNLGYCSHYQIKKMYKSVVENPEAEFPQDILEKIPEKLLPPCEVMMTMILYRSEIDLIPQKIYELVAKYIDMKPEEDTSANLTEKEETKSEEVKNEKEEDKGENKDKKEDVEGEKEEVKDENKDKKEDVKDEKEENKDNVKDEKEEVKGENKNKKDDVKDEKEENKDKKDDVKDEKEEVKGENKDKKDDVKGEKEEVKDENKDKKEDVESEKEEVKDENKDKKEDVKDEKEEVKDENKDKKEEVKDENKEDNKEYKKEEIINEANINNLDAEEDSDSNDSNTDVELEIENDKIKHFKTIETSTITPQIA